MQAIKRRQLGKTGLMVTELSFGAMNLRRLQKRAETTAIVNYVLDQGINLIDTARAYNGELGEGETVESEVVVGEAIRNKRDLPEPILLVTKGHGYTPVEFEQHLQISREKLGITGKHELFIGANQVKLIYFFHGINRERWETIKTSGALDRALEAKAEGRINFIGFSSHFKDTLEIKEAIETDLFDVCELPYNIFNPSLEPLMKLAYDHRLGIVNMKAFGGNEMANMYNVLKDYLNFDQRAMLQFCLVNPWVSTVDAGARYVNEFVADLQTVLEPQPPTEILQEYAREAAVINTSLNLKDLCRDCRHCQEKFTCQQKIDFPTILLQLSRYRLAKAYGKDGEPFRAAYRQLTLKADSCVECGLCEPWCEYDLKIRDLLKQADDELR